MLEKLNDKCHIIFFTNTVFIAAVLCTTSVIQFLLLPQMKQDTVSFTSPNETRKESNITKLKPLSQSEMQNM